MSRTPLPFAPDPNKWIDTSSAKSRKSQLQRPLTSRNNGLSTPPPSTLRRKVISKHQQQDYTPEIPSRQIGLTSWLTPPTTASEPRRRLDRLQKEIAKELNDTTPSGLGKGREPVEEKRRVRRQMNDFWGSDDQPEAGPSRVHSHSSPPSSRSMSRSKSPSVEMVQPALKPVSPNMPRLHPSSSTQSRSLSRAPSHPQPIPSSHLPRLSASQHTSPPPQMTSPPRPITPVPDHILDIHRQLCGQDSNRTKRIRSPWRPKGHTPPPPTPIPKSTIKQVDKRVKDLARDKENAKISVDGKALVRLSDEEENQQSGGVLKSLKPNTSLGKRERSFVLGFESPKRRKLDRTASAVSNKGITTLNNRPSRVFVDENTKVNRRARTPSPHLPSLLPAPTERVDEPTTSSPPPHPLTPHDRSSPLTPRKAKHTPHHKVTPPKSRTSKGRNEHIMEQNETLFAFPSPPPHSSSPPSGRDERRTKGWEPVDMNAETLLTWSLPAVPQENPSVQDVQTEEVNARRLASDRRRPNASPLQDHHRSESKSSETESLAPSVASQSFPHLVRSSPTRTSKADLTLAEKPLVEDVEHRSSSPTPAIAATVLRKAQDRWKKLEQGILSAPMRPSEDPITPRPGPSQRKKRAVDGPLTRSQTKLAAFGFFPNQRNRTTRDEQEVFEHDWEDEQDLQFPLEDEGHHDITPVVPRTKGMGKGTLLSQVPEAPYHPDLRLAGIQEIRRREKTCAGAAEGFRQREQSREAATVSKPPSSPSSPYLKSDETMPTSGSSLTSSDLFPEQDGDAGGGSAAAWFEGIGNRRSSEFGSIT